MIPRRLICSAVLVVVSVVPSVAAMEGRATPSFAASTFAASKSRPSAWRTFSSKAIGVAFRYPSSWKLSGGSAIAKSVEVAGSGRTFYALSVLQPGISPGSSAQATLARFIGYEDTVAHTKIYAQTHWITTSLGGRPASAGVTHSATEGGSALSDAIYVAQAHGRVYEIVMTATHKPTLKRLSQFPSVYRQILRSWRFI